MPTPTVAQALQDPKFYGLPADQQKIVLGRLDPNYGALPPTEQDRVLSMGRSKFSHVAPAPYKAPDTGVSISATPNTIDQWLKDVQGDIRYGSGNTLPGRLLHRIGAQPSQSGGGAAVGEIMPGSGTLLGATEAARGVNRLAHGHPIQGTNEIVRGVGQAIAPALAFSPEALPVAAGVGAAGAGTTKGAEALGISPETSEFLGNVVSGLFGLGLSRGTSESKSISKLAAASGKGSTAPLEMTKGDINRVVAEKGIPQTVGQFKDVVGTAKNDLNREYKEAIGPHENRKIIPDQIHDRILSLLTPNMAKTASGKAEARSILAAAREFRQNWTLGELDSERMDANARLTAYESKSPIDQYTSAKKSRSVAIDKAIADGVRETVYPMMDDLSGKPAGYYANIKGRIGNLMKLESNLDTEAARLHDVSTRTKGVGRLDRARVRATIGEGGRPRLWSTLGDAVHVPDVEAKAGGQVRSAFRQPNRKAAIMGLPLKAVLSGEATDRGPAPRNATDAWAEQ